MVYLKQFVSFLTPKLNDVVPVTALAHFFVSKVLKELYDSA